MIRYSEEGKRDVLMAVLVYPVSNQKYFALVTTRIAMKPTSASFLKLARGIVDNDQIINLDMEGLMSSQYPVTLCL